MSVATHCWCQCHNSARGDYNDAFQHDAWHRATILSQDPFVNILRPVPANDPLEAAVASGCSCINHHAEALQSNAPPYLPPSEWHPDNDATGDGAE